jgi:hypothetical protein
MTAHRERPRARKIDLDRLARRLLRGVERHVFRIDVDLMEEFVLVGKQNRVAPGDRDRSCCEVAAFLDDSVDRGGTGKARNENKDEKNYDAAAAPYQFPRDHRKSPVEQRLGHAHFARMRVMRLRATWLFGILVLAPPGTAAAEDIAFFVNGFVDAGGVIPSHDKSWIKGGYGKLDNGGGGGQSPTVVGQGVADLRVNFDPAVSFFTTLRVAPDQHAPFDILRYQPISTRDWLLSIKLGAFFPPISLERERKRRLDQPVDADPVGDQFLGRR